VRGADRSALDGPGVELLLALLAGVLLDAFFSEGRGYGWILWYVRVHGILMPLHLLNGESIIITEKQSPFLSFHFVIHVFLSLFFLCIYLFIIIRKPPDRAIIA
jgi:hypothetical protein